jgi:hypothetical protein
MRLRRGYFWAGCVLAGCLGGFVYWRYFTAAQPELARSFDGRSDKKRESERPFFVMWVDNAKLLSLR